MKKTFLISDNATFDALLSLWDQTPSEQIANMDPGASQHLIKQLASATEEVLKKLYLQMLMTTFKLILMLYFHFPLFKWAAKLLSQVNNSRSKIFEHHIQNLIHNSNFELLTQMQSLYIQEKGKTYTKRKSKAEFEQDQQKIFFALSKEINVKYLPFWKKYYFHYTYV